MKVKVRSAPLILALALLGGRASATGFEDPPLPPLPSSLPPLPPLPPQSPPVGSPNFQAPTPNASQQGAHPPQGKAGTEGNAQVPGSATVPPSTAAPDLLPTTPGATNPAAAASPTAAGTQGDAPGSNLSSSTPNMIGDSVGARAFAQFPTAPPPNQPYPPGRIPGLPRPTATGRSAAFVPSVRGLKIAENQSPRPQDRIFFSFNYFDDVNGRVNRDLGSPLRNMQVYREIWGFEKTFAEGNGSFGMRIPLDTLSASSVSRGGPGGSSTSVGDLTIFGKYILLENTVTGSLISGGLAVTAPTGPSSFAGASYLSRNLHSTSLQPFLGYIWNKGNFYAQGFTAVDVSTDPNQSTLLYNDVGVGYFVYKSADPRSFITAIAPTFEAHVTTPLNHRDYTSLTDIGSTYDVVNLTYGLNVVVGSRSVFTFGYVSPVTGPRPFSGEALLLYNFRFGGKNRQQFQTPPVTSG